jgi:hypothetical protein
MHMKGGYVMKRIIAAIFIMLFMAPAPALADFYVIAGGGLPAGTEIKSLPAQISSSGFYFIKKDLNSAPAPTA